MRLFRLPITISLLIHITVFLSAAWIKFGNEYIIAKATPVELLKQGQDRLVKRQIPIRSKYLVGKITNQYAPSTAVRINITDPMSTIVYGDIQSPIYVENISYSNHKSGSFSGIYHVPIRSVSHIKNIPLRQVSIRPSHKSICDNNGDKFINNKLLVLAKPDMNIKFVQKDNRSLRRFLDTIRKKIEANKKYPISAMESGIEGRSGVRIAILRDGQLEIAEIIDSSRNGILDHAALESVYSAAPFPPIPSDIELNRIEISVYIVFKISQFGK